MPAMFVLAILAGRSLGRLRPGSLGRAAVGVVLLIGSLTALLEVRRNVFESDVPLHSVTDAEAVPSVPLIYGGSEYFSQYVASTDSFFFEVRIGPRG